MLGQRKNYPISEGEEEYTAIISAAKDDKDHPRKAAIRAFIHRGGKVISTEGSNVRIGQNAPARHGWTTADNLSYPNDQEE